MPMPHWNVSVRPSWVGISTVEALPACVRAPPSRRGSVRAHVGSHSDPRASLGSVASSCSTGGARRGRRRPWRRRWGVGSANDRGVLRRHRRAEASRQDRRDHRSREPVSHSHRTSAAHVRGDDQAARLSHPATGQRRRATIRPTNKRTGIRSAGSRDRIGQPRGGRSILSCSERPRIAGMSSTSTMPTSAGSGMRSPPQIAGASAATDEHPSATGRQPPLSLSSWLQQGHARRPSSACGQ